MQEIPLNLERARRKLQALLLDLDVAKANRLVANACLVNVIGMVGLATLTLSPERLPHTVTSEFGGNLHLFLP